MRSSLWCFGIFIDGETVEYAWNLSSPARNASTGSRVCIQNGPLVTVCTGVTAQWICTTTAYLDPVSLGFVAVRSNCIVIIEKKFQLRNRTYLNEGHSFRSCRPYATSAYIRQRASPAPFTLRTGHLRQCKSPNHFARCESTYHYKEHNTFDQYRTRLMTLPRKTEVHPTPMMRLFKLKKHITSIFKIAAQ